MSISNQTLRGMATYQPQQIHKSTSDMVGMLAQIHVKGNDPAKASAKSIQQSLVGVLTDKVNQSTKGKDFDTALAKLKTEITNTSKLGHGVGSVQDKALTIIRGMEMKRQAEAGLEMEMSHHMPFANFDNKQNWRMVMDGYQQAARGEYGFENESGYMAGTFNGLTRALQSARNDEPLSVDLFIELHDTCVNHVMPMGTTMGEHSPEYLESGLRDHYKPNSDIERRVGFALTEDRNMTKAGMRELRDPGNGAGTWYELTKNNEKDMLKTFAKTTGECRQRATDIIDSYHREIRAADTPDKKLAAIARCCRDLEISHLFADGNARTVGFCVANKLLIENGFSPVILENPNRFDGYSVNELVQELKDGMEKFASHCNDRVRTGSVGHEGLVDTRNII